MSTKTYYINSPEATYNDDEFAWFQSLLLAEGVIGDSAGAIGLSVSQNGTPDMSVLVSIGKALVELTKSSRTFKVVVDSDAQEQLTIAANATGSNRVDAVVLRVSESVTPNALKTNVATIEVVLGTGTSALSDAAIDSALGNDGWYRLANVTVANGASSIVNANIADTRTKVAFNNGLSFADLLPTGSILPYGGASAPISWLLCNGQAVSRTTYATLFSVLGTAYGVGDGSTTFNLPDFRGAMPIGAGTRAITFSVTAENETNIGNVATADASNNRLLLSSVAGLSNGDAVILTGSVPTGITAGQTYYVRVSASYIYLYNDRSNAIAANSSYVTFTGTQTNAVVWEASRTFTVDAQYADLLETGAAITFNASVVPTGLTASTTYYVYKITETTFNLTLSRDNALKQFNAPFMVGCLASTGSGFTFTVTGVARTRGHVGGAEAVNITVPQLPKHRFEADSVATSATVDARDSTNDNVGIFTPDVGGNVPHENMPPYAVANYIIKA